MKRAALINRHISALIATLGHGDEIIIADAGLPVPDGVPVIDLAVKIGVPSFFEVLDAVRSELQIERAVWATEAATDLQERFLGALTKWQALQDASVEHETISHEALKVRSASAKAIIRTGEATPYANVILISGVVF